MDETTHETPVVEPPRDDLQPLLQTSPNGGRSNSTVVLAAFVLVAAGFIGGLFVGKSMGNDSQQVAFRGGFGQIGPAFGNGSNGQVAFPGGFGQNGPGFGNGSNGNVGNGNGGGFLGDFTIGTIKSIDGDTITLETANGDTITVNVGSDTQIQITRDGSVGDLDAGDTAVVAGTRDGGSLDATSITEGGASIPIGAAVPPGSG